MSWTKKTGNTTIWQKEATLSSTWIKKIGNTVIWQKRALPSSTWTKKSLNYNFSMSNVDFNMTTISWTGRIIWQERI